MPDMVAFVSSLPGAFYFLMNAKNVSTLPIFSLIFFMNLHVFLINALIAKAFDSEIKVFSLDPVIGCLGFFDKSCALVAFIPYGFLSSICGSAGYVLSLMFYSPVVVANAFLLEPICAQILGYFLKIDKMPGYMTFMGIVIALMGVVLIDYTTRKKEKARIENENEDKMIKEL